MGSKKYNFPQHFQLDILEQKGVIYILVDPGGKT